MFNKVQALHLTSAGNSGPICFESVNSIAGNVGGFGKTPDKGDTSRAVPSSGCVMSKVTSCLLPVQLHPFPTLPLLLYMVRQCNILTLPVVTLRFTRMKAHLVIHHAPPLQPDSLGADIQPQVPCRSSGTGEEDLTKTTQGLPALLGVDPKSLGLVCHPRGHATSLGQGEVSWDNPFFLSAFFFFI